MSSVQKASLDAKSERQSGSAPIATGELDKSDEECPSPEVVLSKSSSSVNTPAKETKSPPVSATLPQQQADASGSPIREFFLDESFAPQNSVFGSKGYQNFEDELYTFEEFLDFTDKPVLTERIDEFHSIALDSPRRERRSPVAREPKGRERNYTVGEGWYTFTCLNYSLISESEVPRLPYQLDSTPFPENFQTQTSEQQNSSSSALPTADFSRPQVVEASPNPTNFGPIVPPRDSVNQNMGLIRMICCLKSQNRSHHYHAPSETTPAASNRPTQYSW